MTNPAAPSVAREFALVSPPEACGASWLINALLEVGICVGHAPAVEQIWRNSRPQPDAYHIWHEHAGRHALHRKAAVLRKWLPAVSRRESFAFRPDIRVRYTQDLARNESRPQDVPRGRTIYFVRDPRDAIHSMYRRLGPAMSLNEFVSLPNPRTLLDRIDHWSLGALGWLESPAVPHFRFEDSKADPVATLAAVLDVLETNVPRDEIERAAMESTFEKAREAEVRYRREFPGDHEVANRAGRVGEWREAGITAFAQRVARQAPTALRRLGYAVDADTECVAAERGFRGAAAVDALAAFAQLTLAEELRADVEREGRLSRSIRHLLAFAEDVDSPLLERSRLSSAESHALLTSLAEFVRTQRQGGALEVRLLELRSSFEDGSAHHFERVRALLAAQRSGRTGPRRPSRCSDEQEPVR